MSRAKTVDGLMGNLGFIIQHKTWATLVVLGVGFFVGLMLGSFSVCDY